MKNKLSHLLLFLLLTATACTNEIGLMPDNEPSKLIVNALLSADGSRNRIHLHRSGWTEATPVTDGIIRIYINDVLTETITAHPATEEDDKVFYEVKSHFQTGDKVRLEASAENGALRAEAETIVEAPILLLQLDTLGIKENGSWGGYSTKLQLKMDLKSPTTKERKHFRLEVKRVCIMQITNVETQVDSTYINHGAGFDGSKDVALTDGQPSNSNSDSGIELFPPWTNHFGIFNDAFFKEGCYTMTVLTNYPSNYIFSPQEYTVNSWASYIDLQIVAISAQEYQYLKAISLYADTDNSSPLETPVIIPNHIKYGIGIFAIENSVNHRILVE